MAISQATFGDIGGAVGDLFGGIAAGQQGALKAKGLNLQAQGLRIKAQGDLAEAQNYDLATTLANQNAQFTETSTAIKEMQAQRQIYQGIGATEADVAASGFSRSGSALDLLADSTSQGALSKAVLGQQGLITEAGYKEQAQSYQVMSAATRAAAAGEEDIANQTDELANETRSAAKTAEIGDFIGGAIKGVAAIATLL